MKRNAYIYIFIRTDLTVPQQIIQAAHAVDELQATYTHGPGSFMVLCGVKDAEELLKVRDSLEDKEVRHVMFFEPDLNSSTAIATVPLKWPRTITMRKFKLMT